MAIYIHTAAVYTINCSNGGGGVFAAHTHRLSESVSIDEQGGDLTLRIDGFVRVSKLLDGGVSVVLECYSTV